jgi:hypothetical protein
VSFSIESSGKPLYIEDAETGQRYPVIGYVLDAEDGIEVAMREGFEFSLEDLEAWMDKSTREKFVHLVRNEEDDDLDLFKDFEDAREYAEMFEGSTCEEVPVLGRQQARSLIEEAREEGQGS